MIRVLLPFALVAAALLAPLPATAAPPLPAQDMGGITIEVQPVRDGVFMLLGQGGNIGLSVGDDGAFLVDDQYAPLSDKILAAVASVTDEPVRFVANTHWHGDHTGGNENIGATGALIVAHENVRERMSTDQFMEAFGRTTPASPPAALPVITFTDKTTFHWNGGPIEIFHVAPAHTDGDAIVHFRDANVVHMGDCFFNGMYPFLDTSSGGRIDGLIAAANRVLALCDDETQIIPGHGSLGTPADLRASRDMLVDVRGRLVALLEQGLSADEIVAAKPTADLDEIWGGGFMQPDIWVGIVVASLADR